MRDPKRIDIVLKELGKFWKKYPDLRLGQIVANISRDCGFDADPFFMEDTELLEKLKEYNEE
jgi:uncharacterized protein YihD (DUF1040 family)